MGYRLVAVVGPDLATDRPSEQRDKVVHLSGTARLELVHLKAVELADERFGSYHVDPDVLGRVRRAFPGPPGRGLVEAEFWGGTGYQFASVWSGGHELLPPLTTSDHHDDPEGGPWPNPPPQYWAINLALMTLGVESRPGHFDAFEAVGLGRPLAWSSEMEVSLDEV